MSGAAPFWRGKTVLVLGLGVTGLSCARWLQREGASVRVADTRANPPQAGVLHRDLPDLRLFTGPFDAHLLDAVELVLLSPGLSLDEPLVQLACARGIEVLGDIELFALALRRRAETLPAGRPVLVGVTGSNGKSTVTTMVREMGRAAGLNAVAAGNIGLPALDALPQDEGFVPDLFVLELSSFQLETTRSLVLRAATVLNISEDHLDRYSGIAQYAQAKARIFADTEVQVLNRADPASSAMALPGRSVLTFALDEPRDESEFGLRGAADDCWIAQGRRNLLRVSELPLTGQHNAANAAAALALCHAAGIAQAPAVAALRSFRGLPHRVERVREIQGVVFFDDSKGTNVRATVAALAGMAQPVVLIAGGDGKGQDFSPLNEAVRKHARALIVIGHDAERITAAVASSGVPCSKAASLEEAVQMSFCAARPGDAVLLSPACASFDMFDNYAHRARLFVEAVGRLQERCAYAGGAQ